MDVNFGGDTAQFSTSPRPWPRGVKELLSWDLCRLWHFARPLLWFALRGSLEARAPAHPSVSQHCGRQTHTGRRAPSGSHGHRPAGTPPAQKPQRSSGWTCSGPIRSGFGPPGTALVPGSVLRGQGRWVGGPTQDLLLGVCSWAAPRASSGLGSPLELTASRERALTHPSWGCRAPATAAGAGTGTACKSPPLCKTQCVLLKMRMCPSSPCPTGEAGPGRRELEPNSVPQK